MNMTEYARALEVIAERGQPRGAEEVYAAADAKLSGTADPPAAHASGSSRRWRILSTAAAIAVIAAGILAVRGYGADSELSTASPPQNERQFQVTFTSPTTGGLYQERPFSDLVATIESRVLTLGLTNVTVARTKRPNEQPAVVVSAPASIPDSTMIPLLSTPGRLAVTTLDGSVHDEACGQDPSKNHVSSRSGQWPTWGAPIDCYSTGPQRPAYVVAPGDAHPPVLMSGAKVDVSPAGVDTDVIVHFGAANTPTAPGAVVTFDGVVIGPEGFPASTKFYGVAAADAQLLRAILLSQPYDASVVVAAVGTDATSAEPTTSSASNTRGTQQRSAAGSIVTPPGSSPATSLMNSGG